MAGAVDQAAPALSVPEYVAQIDHTLAELDSLSDNPERARSVADSLPASWTVSDGNKTFTVPTDWLRSELRKEQKPDSLKTVRERLRGMRAAAQAYSSPAGDNSAQRTAINSILARREFRNVHGPSFWDQLKRRVAEWLFRLLGRVIGSSAFPTVTRVVVWSIVGIAVLFVAWAVFRAIRRNAGLESIVIPVEAISAKEWTVWLSEARAAAARGDWREAIHLSYWAGISLLESRGMWRPDRARTPREYLRLLPAESEHHPALKALTRRFEVVWYGHSMADEQAYSQTLTELEKLGCR